MDGCPDLWWRSEMAVLGAGGEDGAGFERNKEKLDVVGLLGVVGKGGLAHDPGAS